MIFLSVVKRSLSTLVLPHCMSQLLQLPGSVSDFGPVAHINPQPRQNVISIFSPVTFGAQCK